MSIAPLAVDLFCGLGRMSDTDDFLAEDYRFTADLLQAQEAQYVR